MGSRRTGDAHVLLVKMDNNPVKAKLAFVGYEEYFILQGGFLPDAQKK